MAPKECPKCAKDPVYGDIWSCTDQLSLEFECEVQQYTLWTVYWCKRCDYAEQIEWDPEIIHDQCLVGRCS